MYVRSLLCFAALTAVALWPIASAASAVPVPLGGIGTAASVPIAPTSPTDDGDSPYQQGFTDGAAAADRHAWDTCEAYASALIPSHESSQDAYWKGYDDGWADNYGPVYDKHCNP
jgi:hypothetical protein